MCNYLMDFFPPDSLEDFIFGTWISSSFTGLPNPANKYLFQVGIKEITTVSFPWKFTTAPIFSLAFDIIKVN